MGVSFLPKTLVFIFLEKNGTCPGEGGSLADRWRIVGAGPADDIAFSRTPQEALCDLFPNLVDRAPRGVGSQERAWPTGTERAKVSGEFWHGLPVLRAPSDCPPPLGAAFRAKLREWGQVHKPQEGRQRKQLLAVLGSLLPEAGRICGGGSWAAAGCAGSKGL